MKYKYVAYIANALMIIAGLMVSVSVSMALHFLPYTLFLLSHIMWAWYAGVNKQGPALQLNLVLLLIDMYAVGIRIF